MTHKKRHNWTPQKLVFLMMGFLLSLMVSLPAFAYKITDRVTIDGKPHLKLEHVGTYRKCEHCHTHPQIQEGCNAAKWGHGHGFIYADSSGVCACVCGCIAGWTLVTLADGTEKRADQLKDGDVIAVMTVGGLKPVTIERVTTSVVTNYLAHQVTFSNGALLTASENHTVLSENDELVTLESLSIGDGVRLANGQVVTVTAKELVGYEKLELVNVVLSTNSALPMDHLYITGGIFSGDLVLQRTRDRREQPIELLWDTVDISLVPQKTLSKDGN